MTQSENSSGTSPVVIKRTNGKRQKPGPKFFTSDPTRWCMLIKPSTGKPCKGIRKTGTERCSKHQIFNEPAQYIESEIPGLKWEPPLSSPARTIDDMITLLERTIDDLRMGRVTSQISNGVAVLAREQSKLLEIKERYDPSKVATRAFSREAAAALARVMTLEQARDIIDKKNNLLLEKSEEIADGNN